MVRKRIAVFICGISMENQKKIVDGILEGIRKKGFICYIFTCFVGFESGRESQEGAYEIMRLPELSHFDGAIFMKDSIQYRPSAEELEQRLQASGIPCVNIGHELPGMGSVLVDNYSAERAVTDYLIDKKGARLINFVGGYPGNSDGAERQRGFKDSLLSHGITPDEGRIRDGNYSMEGSRKVMSDWLEEGAPLPDAIVCANDQMVIGVVETLQENGVRVPEDVLVFGFDGEDMCDAFRPRIATVKKQQERIGRTGVEILDEMMRGGAPRTEVITAAVCPSESSGDPPPVGSDLEGLRDEFVRQTLMIRASGDFIRSMASDLALTTSPAGIYKSLKHFILQGDMNSCYLCMCDEDALFRREKPGKAGRIDLDNINTSYTDSVSVPVGYRNGEFFELESFPHGQVLPEECEERDGADFYVVTPVNFHRCCYGYYVSADSYFALLSDLYYLWVSNVGIALENIRKYLLLNGMVERLNEMWIYDPMTKLYNREGFYRLALDELEEMKRRGENSFILFIDLDGLKKVNDTLGHEAGDRYISAMGSILKEKKERNDLAMRFGGDEFVVFGSRKNKEDAEALIKRIESGMKGCCFERGEHTLEASIGLFFCPAAEIGDLNDSIKEADERMYALKQAKKQGKR